MNIQLEKCNAFAREVSRRLYPQEVNDVARWIRETIGEPEFSWDYETVFRGFCEPVRQYFRKTRPVVNGSICAAMIIGEGKDLEAYSAIISAAEHISYATKAYEDVLFGYQYRDEDAGFISLPQASIKDSIASSLILMMSNIFLYRNPLGLDDSTLIECFNYSAREAARMRYVAALQVAWIRRDGHVPRLDQAIQYAVNGPVGSGIRMMLVLTAMSLAVSPEVRESVSDAAGMLGILEAIQNSIENVTQSSARKFGEDFRIGKITPLTVLTSQDRALDIRKIPVLLGGLKIGVIAENAICRALNIAKTCVTNIETLRNLNPDASCLAVISTYAENLFKDTLNLAGAVEGVSLNSAKFWNQNN